MREERAEEREKTLKRPDKKSSFGSLKITFFPVGFEKNLSKLRSVSSGSGDFEESSTILGTRERNLSFSLSESLEPSLP